MPLGIKFLIGIFISLLLTAAWADRKPWRKVEGTRLVFRRPLTGRFALGGMGLLGVTSVLLMLLAQIRGGDGPLFFVIGVALILCLGAGLMFLMAGLRRDLSLDTQQQTYKFMSGWGWHPAVYSGGFEDFGGVFVREPPGYSKSEQYVAGLVWKSGGRTPPLLGMSGKQPEMEALAEEMVRVLGVSVVSAPPPETLRDVFRRKPAV